jgi:hypothetical protein
MGGEATVQARRQRVRKEKRRQDYISAVKRLPIPKYMA